MNNEELWAKVIADAEAETKKQLAEQEAEVRVERKTVLQSWKESRKKRELADHEARVKNGRELAEAFLQEVAGPYLRMATNPANEKVLASIRLLFVPGKSDGARSASVRILDGSKTVSTVYKASLQQLEEKELRLLGRLQQKTGFNGNTPLEMMEEIARLQEAMDHDSRTVSELSPIATAAQQLLLARAEGRDNLEAELDHLEQMFIPAHKRKKPEDQVAESPLYESSDDLSSLPSEETTKMPVTPTPAPSPSEG